MGLRVNSLRPRERLRVTREPLWLLCSTLLLAMSAPALAQPAPALSDAPVPTYALLIGSNPGGDGQAELHYAQNDAESLAQVLTQLGHFPSANTHVLLGPDRAGVLQALEQIGTSLKLHRARGEQAQFVFYYSGHARAATIQLGSQELPLSELRERILALPTALTLIVLDACQSGAFTNVKGAQPAAAFSYNSVARLRTSGVAVMASSSASELSQESSALHGSYFTHHLMVGLRGAGDSDHDGVVSLEEAYRYAYARTLSATARTAVGGQHVTLQTALTGQGEVPITYPAQAGAQLELAADLDSDLLIEHQQSVVAELHKVPGSSVRLALPAGRYTAVLRRGGVLAECALTLPEGRVTQLTTDSCQLLSEAEAQAKGYSAMASARPRPGETWALELAVALGHSAGDAYTHRLGDFGFAPTTLHGDTARWQVAVSRQLDPHLSAVADLRTLDGSNFTRDLGANASTPMVETFSWWTLAFSLNLRAHIDASESLRFYAQLGGGAGLAFSRLRKDSQTQAGPVLSGSVGMNHMAFGCFGFFLQATYSYAPLLHNELDDVHNSGGFSLSIGLRLRNWSQP
jgi:Caspase domain